MLKHYRIVDSCCNETLANALASYEQAHETLLLLQTEYPKHTLEIEEYTIYTVKGLGRDPDLH